MCPEIQLLFFLYQLNSIWFYRVVQHTINLADYLLIITASITSVDWIDLATVSRKYLQQLRFCHRERCESQLIQTDSMPFRSIHVKSDANFRSPTHLSCCRAVRKSAVKARWLVVDLMLERVLWWNSRKPTECLFSSVVIWIYLDIEIPSKPTNNLNGLRSEEKNELMTLFSFISQVENGSQCEINKWFYGYRFSRQANVFDKPLCERNASNWE